MSHDGMTRQELLSEAYKIILHLTDEQCKQILEQLRKESKKTMEASV